MKQLTRPTLLASALFAAGLGSATHADAANPFDEIRRQVEKSVQEQIDKALPAPRPDSDGGAQHPPPQAPSNKTGSGMTRPRGAGHVQLLQTFTASDEIVPVQVPVVDGKPVFGYNALLTSDASQQEAHWLGDAQALRWLVLMNIAQRPALLDKEHVARQVAAMFLPAARWKDYLACPVPDNMDCDFYLDSRARASNRMPGGSASFTAQSVGWKGRNEFERPRSHRAFVDKYRPILVSQAARLPQEIVLFQAIHLGIKYSHEKRLLPMPEYYGTNARRLTTIPLLTNYCASVSLQWPDGISVRPEEAEALLYRLDQRKVYAALRLRLKRVDGESVPPMLTPAVHHGGGDCRVDADVLELTLHGNPALTSPIHKFQLAAVSK